MLVIDPLEPKADASIPVASGDGSGLTAAPAGLPMSWSPDGRWVAYTVSAQTRTSVPQEGSIYEICRSSPGEPDRAGEKAGGARVFRVYAAERSSGTLVLLGAALAAGISAVEPGWPRARLQPVGTELPSGTGRFEVVIQDSPQHKQVLLAREFGSDGLNLASSLPFEKLAWSPDGRYLAVPNVRAGGLSIVRRNGRVVKTMEGVSRPSWSPDGTRLAMVLAGRMDSIETVDPSFGPPRRLAQVGETFQEPTWSRDSRSIFTVVAQDRRSGPRSCAKVTLEDPGGHGTRGARGHLGSETLDRLNTFRGVSYSLDRDGNELFATVMDETQPSAIAWLRPRTQETVDRFNPLDVSSGSGRCRFRRMARPWQSGSAQDWPERAWVTARWGDGFTPIASDEPSRREWLSLLVGAATDLLARQLPPPMIQGRAVARPTILPVPGDLEPNREISYRLSRIGRIGRNLCRADAGRSEGELGARGVRGRGTTVIRRPDPGLQLWLLLARAARSVDQFPGSALTSAGRPCSGVDGPRRTGWRPRCPFLSHEPRRPVDLQDRVHAGRSDAYSGARPPRLLGCLS